MKNNKFDIKEMPKVELHVHIEGSVSSKVYFQLAEKNKVKLPCSTFEEWERYFEFKNFSHFIDVYGIAVSTIRYPEDLTLLIEDFYGEQNKQNIVYSEAFLSASFLIENFKKEEILESVEKGMQQGEEKYGVQVNIIPDIARHLPNTQEKVFNLVKTGYKRGIFIGLGLGGLEVNFPAKLFVNTFEKANETGMKMVAHAGEAVGPESIWEAIQELHVERIGHGIRCLEDEDLMSFLKETQISIEVSPTSNYHLGVVNSNENHPIRQMVNAGLNCCINTDDSAMFSTTLSNEFKLLLKQGFKIEELIQLNRNAIKSSFLGEDEKQVLSKMLDSYIKEKE